jgi:hypothetical protein
VGEHTVDVLRDWAGLPDGDIDRLLAGGVVVQGRVEQVAGR